MTEHFLDELILDVQAPELAERPAVIAGDRVLTYGDLVRHVGAFAGTLSRASIGPGDFVVVLAGPTDLIHVAALSVFRLGAVYVPLDPDYPDAQLLDRIAELERVTIVTTADQATRVAGWGYPVVPLDTRPTGEPLTRARERGPRDAACVFFTSGSTGKPKAALGSVRAVVRSVVEPMEFLDLTRHETINSIARYSWSISLLELFGPLAFGGTCLLLDRMQALNLRWLVDAAAKTTGFHCPPALLGEVATYLEQHPERVSELSGVRLVWYGGDSIAPGVLDRCRRLFPRARLATAYGCTEIFGLSHAHFYPNGEPLDRVSIGKPAPGVLQILDGPPGDLQELLLGGERVALGYRGRDELNREKFIVRNGARYYRTGDYVREDRQGSLAFVERQDSQVKIRGIRVEVGEVEQALTKAPDVANGVVLALDAAGETKELHAFFVPANPTATAAAVRRHMSAVLPEHLVPSRFHALTALPMTSNFKIDRKQLTELARLPSGTLYEADSDLGRVAAAWLVAGAEPTADPTATFFDQGGDSLSAGRLAAELTRVFGVTVEVADVFAAPTLSAQVERLLQLTAKKATLEATSSAVEAQRGLFFRELLEGRKGTISCTRYIRRETGFDDDLVKRALSELLGRFPTLRTGLRPSKGELVLMTRSPEEVGPPAFERVSGVWSLEAGHGAPLVQKRAIHFELAGGALAGAIVSRLEDGSDLLQLTAHHVAADDNSMGRVADDFVAIYDALARGRPPSLLPLLPDFTEFCAEQHGKITSGAYLTGASKLGERLAQHLERHPTPILTSVNHQHAPSVTHTVALPAGQSPRFSDVVAALTRALGDFTGRTDFVFCAHVALRRNEPQAPRVGMFVNLVPLFCSLGDGLSQRQLSANTARALREAMAQSDIPYELVLRSRPDLRRRGRFPFDAFVNELRFDNTYPRGYEDVYVRRSFATDSNEVSLSVVRRPQADELHFEAPGEADVPALLERLAMTTWRLLGA